MRGKQFGFFLSVCTIAVFILFTGILSPITRAFGEESKKDLPPRGISIAPDYTGVVVKEGDNVSIDLKVYNRGRQDEDINLSMESVPKGWDARIKTYSFGVTGVHVPSDDSKSLTLQAEPGSEIRNQ